MSKTSVIDVDFMGGLKVGAVMGDTTVFTDQSVKEGGEGFAPEPFDLFLASLVTCAGVYALRFLDKRELPREGFGMRAICEYAEQGFHVDRMTFELTLPGDFPEKYVKPLLRTVDLCAVKKHLMNPPEFELKVV